jgi:hypothetical protein
MSGPNIAQNNEQILNDIQTLQEMEQKLLNNLEANAAKLTPQQQEQIVEKMNQISNMRINLYQTLSGVNNFFQDALSSSIGTLQQQTVAIDIIENELNQSKRRLDILENERQNKIRLVEINDYYGEKYAEHSQFMKIIIFTLIPVIILAFLYNTGLVPDTIYYVLLVIISAVGAFFIWRRFASIIMRDNMNYQAYNWFFDPKSAPSASPSQSATDPWAAPTGFGTCIGQNCCSTGQTWDDKLNQCVGSSSVSSDPSIKEPFVTESMVLNALTKKQTDKYKADYTMDANYQGPQSTSFITK